jgi:putative membrane-bound dehydrogenase-like protein
MPWSLCRSIYTTLALLGALYCLAVRPATAQISAEDEQKALKPATGMEVSVFASEPMVINPSAIDIDTKGRVWVAEIQYYRSAAKEPPQDKIKVLEDTDGDGRADKVTVFAEGLFCPMSVCVAGDKVFVATSPDLWVYEDKNGDLKADGPPKKLLTGFGGKNHDHGAHSLVLGPDHKWWMSHGDQGFKVEGTDGSKIEYKWGAVLRGELDGSQLETVALNFRNPYEVCVSSFGESFLSDNDNDGNFSARICWILSGGNYGWFGHPPARVSTDIPFSEHWHFRGFTPGYVPATLVTGFGSPCGICFYEGDAFGPRHKNAPIHADAGPREVRIYRHEKSGAGMRATNEVILSSGEADRYFRPDDVCAAPDGSLLVSDWYDGAVGGHAYNNPTQGRIFRLTPKDKTLVRVGKSGPYDNAADALEALKSPNLATQFLARAYLLANPSDSAYGLLALLKAEDPNFRARALWILDRMGGTARENVLAQLKNPSGRMRALAVRILRRHNDDYADQILAMAADPEIEVRREVLLAMPTIKIETKLAEKALLQLASEYDGADRYLLEAIYVAAGDSKQTLAAQLANEGLINLDTIDLVKALDPDAAAKFLLSEIERTDLDDASRIRLLARLGAIDSLDAAQAVLATSTNTDRSVSVRNEAITILGRNLGGDWKQLKEQPEFGIAVSKWLSTPDLRETAIEFAAANNVKSAAPLLLETARADALPVLLRRSALRAAVKLDDDEATPLCASLVECKHAALRQAAVEGLVDLQAWPAVKKLFTSDDTPAALKEAAANRAMESAGGALVMLRLIEEGALPQNLREGAIAAATKHADTNLRILFERFIPEADRPKRLGASVKPEEILALKGDQKRGQQIFFKSSAARCNACHKVNGKGQNVGPDLSQIGKKYDARAMLETILEPSKAIAPEFVVHLVETDSGTVLAGFILEKNNQELKLKDSEGKTHTIPTAEIVGVHPQVKSMMPELVLQEITAQDAADLLTFLASLKPDEPVAGQ